MNKLKIFKNNEFGEVRTLQIENEPWFVAMDICKALDIKNTTDAIKRLDEDEVTRFNLGGLSGTTNIVNEFGLYNLVLASRKKEAKRFKRWVTHEVIPSIRKHGAYMTEEVTQKALSDPDFLIQLATNLKEERAKRQLAEAENQRNKPKVVFAESCEVAENNILIGELAKRLKQNGVNIGQNRMFQWLRENGYLGKGGNRYNLPTQYSMDLELFEVKTRTVNNADGTTRMTYTPMVTGKGQIYFTNKFI